MRDFFKPEHIPTTVAPCKQNEDLDNMVVFEVAIRARMFFERSVEFQLFT